MGGCIRQVHVAVLIKWLDYGVRETILLYRFGWDPCILAVIGRWLLCSGGCLLRFYCTVSGKKDWPLPSILQMLQQY